MRTSAKLAAGVAVLLAIAGCTGDPEPSSAPLTREGPAAADMREDLGPSGQKKLLAEDGDYRFYTAPPNHPRDGDACLIIEIQKQGFAATTCDRFPSVTLEMENPHVEAKLISNGYDARTELDDGWRQLHKNLLVRY